MYFQSIRDELELKEANVTRLLVYDSLTGAYNRAYFEHAGSQLLENLALPLNIAMSDINGLKLINDTFGHEKGDELLVSAVKTMKESIGDDHLIIRWGGDEFVIVMPGLPLSEAEVLLNQARMNLRPIPRRTIPVDISFGLSVITSREQSLPYAIRQAEEKMYSSKLQESKKTRMEIIEFLEKLLWEKDYQTEEHVMRLKSLVSKFGAHVGLSSREIAELTQSLCSMI
jgi:diguanylate cyclase (GGDEF)-like protein